MLDDSDATHDIVKAVFPVNKWEHLGLALKIKAPILDAIKLDHRGIIADCRYAMIMQWLREGNASWKELCLALAEEYVGHINLAKQIANQHRISQPTDQSTTYLQQLGSNLPHPIPVSGKQLARDKAIGPYGTLGEMLTSNNPTVIVGNIASDSHSLPLNQQKPVSFQPQLVEVQQTPIMAEEQHEQLYSGFINPSDVYSPDEMETGDSKLKSEIVMKKS